MKVLIFNTLYYPNHIGGAERSVQLIAERFVVRGHSVRVFSNGIENHIYEKNGVKIRQFKTLNIYNFLSQKKHRLFLRTLWHLLDAFNPFYFWTMYKDFMREKPEVVWTNNLSGFSVSAWFISKVFGIPVVHTVRDYYLLCPSSTMFSQGRVCEKQCFKCKLMSLPKKLMSQKVDAFVGISNFILQKHLDYFYFPKAHLKRIVYNSLSGEEIEVRPKLIVAEFNQCGTQFGFLGSLSQSKGVEFLLNEFQLFLSNHKEHSDAKLIIGGTGSPTYEKYLKTMFSSPNISFLGKVKPDVFFSKIDVLVVPSLWDEPFGRVVVEAFQNHKRVLATNRGGLLEFKGFGNIDYFEIENGAIEALMKKYADKNPIFDIEIWDRCKTSFDSSVVAQQYLDIFHELVNV